MPAWSKWLSSADTSLHTLSGSYLYLVNEPFHTSKMMSWSRTNIVHYGFLSVGSRCVCIILLGVAHFAINDADVERFTQIQAQ